jgi:hypothetical protein
MQTRRQTKALQTKAIQTKALQTKALQTKALQTNALQTKALQTNALQTKAIQTKALQTKAIQTKALQNIVYDVNIDFEEASASWRQNKKSIGNGSYKYICTVLKKDQTMCNNSCYKLLSCCWAHRKLANK